MGDKSILKRAINGFKFTLVAQIMVLLLGVVKSLIVPKILSIPDYGYWQIYVLYSSYIGVFSLGYNDGIYLKYGKKEYDELPSAILRISNRYYVLMLVGFAAVLSVVATLVTDNHRGVALFAVSLDIVLTGISGMLLGVLQITNQMKAYSLYSVLDKIVMLMGILIIICAPNSSFRMIMWTDVLSRTLVTILLVYRCRTLFFGKGEACENAVREFFDNIRVGISLMIANLMGMFVTGIGRFIVDTIGEIEEYAYYSFAISITNLVLVFISSISLVLYPTLKRLSEDNYKFYYEKINIGMRCFNFIALFAYFPVVIVIRYFLPDYMPILEYLHFLFGVIILQAKMQLLNNTFYKALRFEKALMKENLSCVIVFLVLALLSYGFTNDIAAIAFSTFIAMLYRCFASEIYIRKKLQLKISCGLYGEVAYIIIYILLLTVFDFNLAFITYGLLFGMFFLVSLKEIKRIIGAFKVGIL